VLFGGKPKEKSPPHDKRRDTQGKTSPSIISSTAMPNDYDFYVLDRDFGPLFSNFCSRMP
jgi:hypothetical protein